jgi:hypothetical protein
MPRPYVYHIFACLALASGFVATSAAPGSSASAAAKSEPASETPPATKREARTLKEALLPAIKSTGLWMENFILWCPSVIKVGDTYHLFASRWPSRYQMGGWTTQSEIIRATSKDLLGPYSFQEVVFQKRPDNWDNTRVHNPKIVKSGDKFLLYYIDTANETGYAIADAITGPWSRPDQPVMKISNPAPLVRPDGSIYIFGRLGDSQKVNRGIAFTTPQYTGPYTVLADGANLLQNNAELEDPTIWWASNQYNVLLNDWKGKATGTSKGGAQYFSKDGEKFQLMTSEPVFTKTVTYSDGTSETFRRRERPFVYTNEQQEVVALFTACYDGNEARIVVQPVNRYVPKN